MLYEGNRCKLYMAEKFMLESEYGLENIETMADLIDAITEHDGKLKIDKDYIEVCPPGQDNYIPFARNTCYDMLKQIMFCLMSVMKAKKDV